MSRADFDNARLNLARRRDELQLATDDITDVLVIGGGITGVGIALDAVSRGLSVTLIEAEDLAFGTSRWSSKLVHGGLRYLATGDWATARESASERHLLMTKIAPHLVQCIPQLLPFSPSISIRQRAITSIGIGLGDALRMRAGTPRSVLPSPRLISANRATALVPALAEEGLRGGLLSSDGQLVDDARLVVTIARTAAALGARILTRVRALSLDAQRAIAEDALTGSRFEIRAKTIINATGVWAGSLDEGITVRPSRGTHIVLDAAILGNPTVALTVPHPGSVSRFVFALPQQLGRVIVGVTDEDAAGPIPDVAEPTESEIAFLLTTLNSALAVPVPRDAVRGAFTGLRPLIDTGEKSTADISRRHLVAASAGGFVNVLGGKLTTYRRMAEDAVDFAVAHAGLDVGPSLTADLPLLGARRSTSPPVLDEGLRRRHGSESSAVLREATVTDAAASVAEGIGILRAEIEFAVRSEGALSVDDVLDRRSRIGLVAEDRTRARSAVTEIVEQTLAALS